MRAGPVVPAEVTDSAASAHRQERVREGLTMALYVSLSLLAVMVALPAGAAASGASSPAAVLAITALGLLAAHWLAFRISARLAHRGRLASEEVELLAAQLTGGLVVVVVAVGPVLLLGEAIGYVVSELLLLGFVAGVGYAAARTVPVSRARAFAYTTAVVGLALVVLGIKNLVGH